MEIADFVKDLPKLHHWGDRWSTGGFNPFHLIEIGKLIKTELPTTEPRIIETGAGNSTILFLMSSAIEVVSIAPDADLGSRIRKYCTDHDIDVKKLNYIPDRSEIQLPVLFSQRRSKQTFDFALIDGAHGWPTVFVDFCYLNAMLRHEGVLALDDTQLYSVGELARFLDEQPHFKRIGQANKLCFWKKIKDHEFLPDFGAQPYVVRAEERMAKQREAGVS